MAVAPAPDNLYYDTIYTERYLGLPKDDLEVYKTAAPTNFAKNLKGDLLIVHGTGDDNVHYQQTEYLINLAEEAGFTVTSPKEVNRRGGTITIAHEYAAAITKELMEIIGGAEALKE